MAQSLASTTVDRHTDSALDRQLTQDQLLDAIRDPAVGMLGDEPELSLHGPVHDGPRSLVFKAQAPGLSEALALKVCFAPGELQASGAQSLEQFESMTRASAAPTSRDYRIPRALGATKSGVLVLEWVDAKTLSHMVQSFSVGRRELYEALQAAGRWLAWFHAAHAVEPRPAKVSDLLNTIDTAMMRAGAAVGEHVSAQRAHASLHLGRTQIANLALPCSWLHGDFKPHDIMLAGNTVYGTDMAMRYANPCLHDVVQFTSHLGLLCMHPGAWHRVVYTTRAVNAFMAGYTPIAAGQEVALHWYRTHSLLRLWCNERGAPHDLKTRYNALRFSHMLDRSVRALESAID